MKKESYVKAVYSVFFAGLVIITIMNFILLKYVDVTYFFDNLDSFYSFFMIGFLIAYCLTKLLEWLLKNERGGKVLFLFYGIATIGQQEVSFQINLLIRISKNEKQKNILRNYIFYIFNIFINCI